MSGLLAVAVVGRGVVDPATSRFCSPTTRRCSAGARPSRRCASTADSPFRLDEHLARIAASADRLGIARPEGGLRTLAAQALAAAGLADAVLRLYLTPGREGTGPPVALALVVALPTVSRSGARAGSR